MAFWSPQNPQRLVVKRVVALEGDEVLTRQPFPFASTDVPFGHVWVEGDDRVHSLDSNDYGPVRSSLL